MESEFTDEQAVLGQGILEYPGGGQFYSAQIGRSLSLIGAQGTSGPGGPGPDRRQHKHGGHGGGGAGRGAAINGHTDVASMAADVGGGGGDYSNDGGGGNPSSLAGLLEDIYNFFSQFFSGSQSLPPNFLVFEARVQRGGRHPEYTKIDKIVAEDVPNQGSEAITFCGDPRPCPTPPLEKAQPEFRRPPSPPRAYTGPGAFFFCSAVFTAFMPEIPVGCATTAGGCAVGAIPACVVSAALCTSYVGGLALCYGAAYPNSHLGPPAQSLLPSSP